MAEEMNSEFLLPAEFLDEGFFVDELREGAEKGGMRRYFQPDSMLAMESDEEDYMTCLTRQMAHSFITGENTSPASNLKILATSPQSTLCDAGIWSSSCRGSPECPSQVSSPTANHFEEKKKDDAWDLLYAAAGEVIRMKQNEHRAYARGQLYPPRPTSAHSKSPSPAGYQNTHMLTHQQLQAAHFFQLKQQQLIKQQVSAAWSRQNRASTALRNNGLPVGIVHPRQNQQRQQTVSNMRNALLNRPVPRRESTGTGVFLPRRASISNEPRKKPACSPVLLPARVVQALNLNVHDLRMHSNYEGYFSLDHEMVHGGAQYQHPSTAFASGNDFRLPKEWAY